MNLPASEASHASPAAQGSFVTGLHSATNISPPPLLALLALLALLLLAVVVVPLAVLLLALAVVAPELLLAAVVAPPSITQLPFEGDTAGASQPGPMGVPVLLETVCPTALEAMVLLATLVLCWVVPAVVVPPAPTSVPDDDVFFTVQPPV